MIIGLDIDDTITRHPEFFSLLSHAILNAGHMLIIITFRDDRQATEMSLRQWKIAYNELVTWSLSACLEYGVDEWKAHICRQYKVDIFFDDDPDVLKHIDSSTFCIMPFRNTTKQTVDDLQSNGLLSK